MNKILHDKVPFIIVIILLLLMIYNNWEVRQNAEDYIRYKCFEHDRLEIMINTSLNNSTVIK